MTRFGRLAVWLLVPISSVGCHDHDHDHDYGSGACGQIVAACHDIDPGTGPISECHAIGHDEVETDCEAVLTSCLATCVAGDAGVPTDAPAHDHDAEPHHDQDAEPHHDHDAATSGVCSELASLCHDVEGTLASECHDLGHDGDEASCMAREAECRTACEHAGHAH